MLVQISRHFGVFPGFWAAGEKPPGLDESLWSVMQLALGSVINNSYFSSLPVQLKQLPVMLSRFVGFMIFQVLTEPTASPLPQQTPTLSIFPDGRMMQLHHPSLALPACRTSAFQCLGIGRSSLLQLAFCCLLLSDIWKMKKMNTPSFRRNG